MWVVVWDAKSCRDELLLKHPSVFLAQEAEVSCCDVSKNDSFVDFEV